MPSRGSPSRKVIETARKLLPAVKKSDLSKDLTLFIECLQKLRATFARRRGRQPVTPEINELAEEICKLSRRILFRIWPDDDGHDLAAAVVNLFFVAADHIPIDKDFPLLSAYADNIRLRARDLQPHIKV